MEYLFLFLAAFGAATILPFGSEALLAYYIHDGLNAYVLFVVASIGNTLGSIVNYWLGLKGDNYLQNSKYISTHQLQNAKDYFHKYGALALLFAWAPVIGDCITVAAGMAKYNFTKFLILVLIAKSIRYAFITISILGLFSI